MCSQTPMVDTKEAFEEMGPGVHANANWILEQTSVAGDPDDASKFRRGAILCQLQSLANRTPGIPNQSSV